jgi:hypothetical protein
MDRHYTEAELLETYYTQPGASLPVMMHLADCPPCAQRYETLDKKMRRLGGRRVPLLARVMRWWRAAWRR